MLENAPVLDLALEGQDFFCAASTFLTLPQPLAKVQNYQQSMYLYVLNTDG